jgi:hypothetical protein
LASSFGALHPYADHVHGSSMQDHDTTATTSTAAVASTQQEALELRIRLLEALVGIDTAFAKRPNAQDASIARRGQAVVAGVYDALDRSGTEAIKRFLETCVSNFCHYRANHQLTQYLR